MDDLDRIAAELCALPPAAFTTARRDRVRSARDAGDRDLAARIGALPKPSAAAALVNLLVGDAPADLERILALGAELRAAQEGLEHARLRELSGQRRDLLAEVVGATADRAEAQGRRVGAAVLEELTRTLQAATADVGAAAAVRSGRLVRGLRADGFGPVDLAGAVAGGPPPAPPDGPPRALPVPEGTAPDVERERRLREARRAADAAAEEAAAARDRAERAEDRAHAAAGAAERASDAADALRDELAGLRARLREAEAGLDDAEDARVRARDESTRADRERDDAERRSAEAAEALERA